MDEMKIRLTSSFMRGVVSKIASRFLSKKLGYKVKIQLNDLDLWCIDGDTNIKVNAELKMSSDEFKKLIKAVDSEE